MEKLPKVAELAVGDACTGSNPRTINPDQMAKLLKCCYYDEEVDFLIHRQNGINRIQNEIRNF